MTHPTAPLPDEELAATDMERWPKTAAGGRLFTDNEPMDMLESNGVTWDDIRAVEEEAAHVALRAERAVRERVEALLQSMTDEYLHPEDVRTALAPATGEGAE